MKRKKLTSVLIACVLVSMLAGMVSIVTLAGDGTPQVVYDHAKRLFEFRQMEKAEYRADDSTATGETGNGLREYPDLFKNFKNMMPGDSVTQTFSVSAENLRGGVVEILLRADRANDADWDGNDDISAEEQDAFRKLMNSGAMSLTVSWENKYRTYRYTSSRLLAEGVSLGKFSGNERRDVTATLTFSTEAGNELADLQAGIGWVFTAIGLTPPTGEGGSGSGSLCVCGCVAGNCLCEDGCACGDNCFCKSGTNEHHAYIIGKSDGLVHPEAEITRAEVATIFFRLMTDEMREKYWGDVSPYSDVYVTDWFNHAVATLTNAGVIHGRHGNVFDPYAKITRAEFTAMAVRFFASADANAIGEDYFSDTVRHWAEDYINLAHEMNLIEGFSDGTFRPDRQITRAEVMVIVNRALGREPHKDHLLEDMITWPDNMDTEAWYYADVQEATNSHTYILESGEDGETYEVWQEMLEVRDWAALERQWAERYSSRTTGEEVSSQYSYQFR